VSGGGNSAAAQAAKPQRASRTSLRATLLLGILGPVLAFVALNAAMLYRQALQAADTAYDRTLLASAKAIGEELAVGGSAGAPRLAATPSYGALEAFEADNRSRIFYKVSGFAGEMVSGFEDLPAPRPAGDEPNLYAALVHFYDESYRGEPVRMAVLLQPVAGALGQGMATIQVAETLELRRTLARSLLVQTLAQQAALVLGIALVVAWVVQRATAPVRELSARIEARPENDLSPLPAADAPRELRPLVDATNAVMGRLAHLLEHQKRFVRDTSHQLRTPLAVLKAQVQSARRGDVDPAIALAEIDTTLARATELANQMLALAKVEQLRQQGGEPPICDWGAIARAVALDLSALIAAQGIDFELVASATPVRAHAWALRELTRNLLHNAIRHTPPGGRLLLSVGAAGGEATLAVRDSGPGIDDEQRTRLFQPFAGAGRGGGSGLGLAICDEIVRTLGGRITLDNRRADGQVVGLDAIVRLPAEADGTPATDATA
jgi:two-component system sensor histidine kinase TctE